jgi:hypothetical protein
MLPPSLTLFAVRVLSKTPHACFAAVPNAPAATAGCQAGGSCVADRSKRALRVGLTRSTHGRRTAGFGATPSLPRARRRSLHSSFADLHRRAMHAGGLLHGLRRGKPPEGHWMEARVTKLARVSARFSKSLARRRFRPNQEKVRSTSLHQFKLSTDLRLRRPIGRAWSLTLVTSRATERLLRPGGRSRYLINPRMVSASQLCSVEKLEIGKGGSGPGTNSWTNPVWPKPGQKARW